MTIHDILGHTTSELEQWSDEQMNAALAPMFIYTRPISKPKVVEKIKVPKEKKLSDKEQAKQLLKELGIT